MGLCKDRLVLSGEALDEEKMRGDANPFHLCLLRAKYQMLYAIYDNHGMGAALAVRDGDKLTATFPGSALVVVDHFYQGVSCFAAAQRSRKRVFFKRGMKVLATIRKWAQRGNPNVLHYRALLDAELAVYKRKTNTAKLKFESAIAMARGQPHDAALAHERYASFLFTSGDPAEGQFQLAQAATLYREWGAMGKFVSLQENYPEIFESTLPFSYQGEMRNIGTVQSERTA
jgi:hypothetical protein